jgi:hypothetical protein
MIEKMPPPDEAQLERLRDPAYLPSRQEIFDTFHGNLDLNWFIRFCFDRDYPIFEFFNQEHIQALGGYLAGRAHVLGATHEEPVTILEVGAGTGRLSHFLGEVLVSRSVAARIVATDASPKKEQNPYGLEAYFPVEPMDVEDAVQFYEPGIVLSSWMPYGEDWTPAIRAVPSVQEYVLMGETDGGCVGADSTWGVPPYDDDYNPVEGYIPEYEQEGFSRENLDVISQFQICRTDYGTPVDLYPHSRTVSFKRTGSPGVCRDAYHSS